MTATTRWTLLLAIILVGFGCGEQGFPESTRPNIAVETPLLSEVDSGSYVEGIIEITNVGGGELVIDSLSIREQGEDDIREVIPRGRAWNRAHTLKAGESLDLTVRYAPVNDIVDSASVRIEHNDNWRDVEAWEISLPNNHAELKILGTGPNGELSFGDVEPGTSKTKTIVIKNEGDHPLKLDELKLGPNPHFSLEVVGSLEGAGGGG